MHQTDAIVFIIQVADPSNLSQYILDMFHRVMALLMEVRSLRAPKKNS